MSAPRTQRASREEMAWTAQEDDLLHQLYASQGAKKLGELIVRHSVHAIRKRAERMGLPRKASRGHALSKQGLRAALVANQQSIDKTARALGVAPTSLRRRANQLQLLGPTQTRVGWTGMEIALLRSFLTPTRSETPIDPSLFPGRSMSAIQRQLYRLRSQGKDT